MKSSNLLILSAIFIASPFFSGCISLRNDAVHIKPGGKIHVLSGGIHALEGKYKIILGKEKIKGYASKSRILIFTFGDYEGLNESSNFISSTFGFPLSAEANIAAARAMEKVKADGILVTAIKIARSGLWPFTVSEKIEITGRPLYIKGIPQSNESLLKLGSEVKKKNRRLKSEIKDLDYKISVVRKAIDRAITQAGCCNPQTTRNNP